MHRLLLAPILAFVSLTSCSTIQPDGTLKDVVEGEVFTGDARVAPPRHANDMLVDQPETGGPVRWKMRF